VAKAIGVEGLVLERKALSGVGHTRRCASGGLRTHDRRRFHSCDVTVGGLVGAGASPDIEHGLRSGDAGEIVGVAEEPFGAADLCNHASAGQMRASW
jgi:hypothetical protein